MEFQIFVKPVGNWCNLACNYCYYSGVSNTQGGDGNSHLMDRETLRQYIQQHFESSDDDTVLFSWHGGEPMLAGREFYSDVIELQGRFNLNGQRIVNGIQTNGMLLDDEWGRFFSENNFIAGLSIDGPARLHNLHRVSMARSGTFDRVIEGWEILKKYSIVHELLCVVNSSNVQYPGEVYDFFRTSGAASLTFLPLVERIGTSGVSDRSVDPLLFGEFMIEIFDRWKRDDIGRIRVELFEEALRCAFGQGHTVCLFREECGDVPVIEANGNFYSCDHFVSPEYMVGNINEERLGSLLMHPRQVEFGRNKKLTLPEYCRSCEVVDMCNGECPRNRFVLTPDGDPGLNYLCPGYKAIFNHIRPFADMVSMAWRKGQGV